MRAIRSGIEGNTIFAAKKKIVWFEKGIHSHIRINAPERYDRTIEDFTRENADE